MLEANTMRAIGAMLGKTAQSLAQSADAIANDVIDMSPLLKRWKEGAYSIGDVRDHDGYPYKCIQAHDSTGNPSWNPKDTPALWSPYHGTDAEHALPYVAPTHAGDAYNAGEWMIWADKKYCCKQDATIHTPDVLPSAWDVKE